MTDSRAKDAGQLFGDTLALLRANLGLVAAAVALMSAFDIATDLLGRNGQILNLVSLPVTVALQYEISLVALSRLGLAERRGRGRFWALLGLDILYALGILAGLALLVIPGLYLYVRWSLAVPVLIAEDATIGGAFSRSGEEIAGRFWPVAGLLLLACLPWLASFGVALVMPEHLTLLTSLVVNIPLNIGMVGGWCAAVAAYAAVNGDHRLGEVFA